MAWLDRLSIDVVHGDLFEQDTDAVVCNVNVGLRLDIYTLGRELLQREGPSLWPRSRS